jgi:hypothetical protein
VQERDSESHFLLAISCAAPVPAQSSPPLAAALVNVVVANELADRAERLKWMYVINKQDGKQTLTEEQVETKDGPLHRLLAIDGRPELGVMLRKHIEDGLRVFGQPRTGGCHGRRRSSR